MTEKRHATTFGDLSAHDRQLAELLDSRRPLPGAAYRGQLARRLAFLNPGIGHRPARLWTITAACVAGGLLLMAIGAAAGGLI
jgi:hypothetical protein